MNPLVMVMMAAICLFSCGTKREVLYSGTERFERIVPVVLPGVDGTLKLVFPQKLPTVTGYERTAPTNLSIDYAVVDDSTSLLIRASVKGDTVFVKADSVVTTVTVPVPYAVYKTDWKASIAVGAIVAAVMVAAGIFICFKVKN
jgi:hypothetical protein